MRFCAWIHECEPQATTLADLTEGLVVRWAEHLCNTGISGTTYNRYLVQVKRIYTVVTESSKSPFDRLEKQRELHIQRQPISWIDVQRIIDFLPEASEEKLLVLLASYTSQRLSDCIHIRAEDIEDGVWSLTQSKTGHRVQIPLHSNILATLPQSEGYLLPSLVDQYAASRASISRWFKQVLSDLEIEEPNEVRNGRRSFHSLRHTSITRMQEMGTTPLVVQAIAGHTSLAMTMHYTHVTQRQVEDAVALL